MGQYQTDIGCFFTVKEAVVVGVIVVLGLLAIGAMLGAVAVASVTRSAPQLRCVA
jgi:hypothetical protein